MVFRLRGLFLLLVALCGMNAGAAESPDTELLECSNGTVLFREDFGGNNASDSIYGQPLPSDVISGVHFFSTHKWGDEIYNSYDIRKEAIRRRTNAQSHITHVYDGWYADFGDHTHEDDLTRGYFMQIDLDSKYATFYTRKIENLCENTHLLFSFWGHPVNSSSSTTVRITIEDTLGAKIAEEQFVIDCRSNRWQKFSMPFTTSRDNPSVVYKIYSGTSSTGGDFALDDIEVRLCVNPVEVTGAPQDTICARNSQTYMLRANYDNSKGSLVEPIAYTWYFNPKPNYGAEGWKECASGKAMVLSDLTAANSGYYKVIASSSGSAAEFSMCHPASDLIPVIVKNCSSVECVPTDTTFYASFCEGDIYQAFNRKIYTEAGVYTDTLRNVAGCDSFVTMVLSVIKPVTVTMKDTVDFETTTYQANGFSMTDLQVGLNTSILRLKSSHGCDSIVNLELIRLAEVTPGCVPYVVNYEQKICKGETYEFEGSVLGVSKLYTWTYKKTDGCDSIINLNLTVVDPDLTILRDAAHLGDPYHKNGFAVDSLTNLGQTQFDLHLTNQTGCDSTVVLYLTVTEKPEVLDVPSAFTPHTNDGYNDLFMPGYEVYIYDRYGHLMAHSDNGWDGTYKGEVASPGIYVYALKKKDGEMLKGTIEIVKPK